MTDSVPIVSIIVVSYNTQAMTLDCLRSIAAETKLAHEVIVLDNASDDGSAEAIASEFPDLRLIASEDNLGFARANNVAAQYARGEFILLLNPDTVVLDGAIDALVHFARSLPSARIWGGRTVYADGTLNDTCCFQRITLWNSFCRATGITALLGNHRFVSEAYGGWKMDDVRPVGVVTGCFLLIETRLWMELAGFDLRFFMYGEEADLCIRAAKQFGATPHFTPHSQIIHYGGASETVRADKLVRLLTAKITLVQKHFPAWQKPIGKLLYRVVPLGRFVAISLAAKLTGNRRLSESAKIWREVWSRRVEWQEGYELN